MNIEPSLPIFEAIMLAQGEHQDVLGFWREDERFVIHRDDLSKMAAMGLDTLPVSCIAVPEDSPLVFAERGELSATADYSGKLSKFFPVYFVAALYELQSLILRFDVKAYVVGGITRDLILYNEKRMEVQDVDITVEGDAIALADFLTENSRNFTVEDRFPEFGTAKVRYKDSLIFDFASTRQEVYPHSGALPVVVKRGVPLLEDVFRRDFTVNSLAFSIHELGQVLDYCNGIRDLERRRLRVLHPISFFEDPSRMLRAMKFCARFDFQLSDETCELLKHFLTCGTAHYKGGGERIKQELKGFFGAAESPAKTRWLEFFLKEGVYRLINMETRFVPTEETFARFAEAGRELPLIESSLSQYLDRDFLFDVYLCFLCRDFDTEEFQKTSLRLGLTKNERDFVEQFRKQKDRVYERFGVLHEFSSPAEIYDLFKGLHFITIVACMIELGTREPRQMKNVLEAFLKYKRKWEKMSLELDGNDLIELGVSEGKAVGRMLDDLLHAKLAGQVPERLDEIQFVQNTLAVQDIAQSGKESGEGDHVAPSQG